MVTTIIQLGNQTSPTATEAAYRDGFEAAGFHVWGIDQAEAFACGPEFFIDLHRNWWHETGEWPALCVYSRTHNNTALGPQWTKVWRTLEERGTKTASVHLDVFWGLEERERWIEQGDPLFTTGLVMTADGGSDEKWAAAGVNHKWLPPGCDARFIPERAEPIPELAGKVVFVGSAYGYHPAYGGRQALIDFASSKWADRFVIYGNGSPNGPVRDPDLSRVYASDCILLGDSCFAGQRRAYWSDRVPESLGRGGFLLHPFVPGIRSMYTGETLATYEAGNFEDLDAQVGYFLANPGLREGNKERGRALVMRRDTYRHRAREVLEAVGIAVPDGIPIPPNVLANPLGPWKRILDGET